MLSLREAQIALSAAIRSEEAGGLAGLVEDDGMAPEQRIRIYRNNYRLGALAAMQATYPVIERLGGADWFEQSAAKYQHFHPSKSGDLQHLGAAYPEFLRGELADSEYQYFGDVAALEWAYELVMTSEERGPIDLAVLNGVETQDYESLQFVPRPALRLVESVFPIFAIWHANQPGAATDAAICLDAGGSRVLVIRRRDHVELRELAIGSYELLRQFQLGASLGAAAEAAAEAAATARAEFDLTTRLRELLGLEAIAGIAQNIS